MSKIFYRKCDNKKCGKKITDKVFVIQITEYDISKNKGVEKETYSIDLCKECKELITPLNKNTEKVET